MDNLTKEASVIYKRIEEHCARLGILDQIDDMELSMLSSCMALHEEVAEKIRGGGYMMKHATGSVQVSPAWNVYKETYNIILKHAHKFGLNPTDREKILKFAKEEDNSKKFDL